MPDGTEVMVPRPPPVRVTVRPASRTKVAVVEASAFRVSWQGFPYPAQEPLQPVNAESCAAVALSVITVPLI